MLGSCEGCGHTAVILPASQQAVHVSSARHPHLVNKQVGFLKAPSHLNPSFLDPFLQNEGQDVEISEVINWLGGEL